MQAGLLSYEKKFGCAVSRAVRFALPFLTPQINVARLKPRDKGSKLPVRQAPPTGGRQSRVTPLSLTLAILLEQLWLQRSVLY